MVRNFSITTWKTISLGTFEDVQGLQAAILDAGFRIGDWARDVLDKPHFHLEKKKKEVDLVKVSAGDFGFDKGLPRADLYNKATTLGLEMCPLEVGPQLRIQYKNQPKLESLQIGMDPEIDSVGHKSEFRVVHGADGYLWLVGDHKHPNDHWGAKEYFVFVKPRV